MKPKGLAKQEVDLFDEETSEKAKALADKYKESKAVSSVDAVIIRSACNKQLYDVFLVDRRDVHNTHKVLEDLDFDTCSKYVLLHNTDISKLSTAEDTAEEVQLEKVLEAAQEAQQELTEQEYLDSEAQYTRFDPSSVDAITCSNTDVTDTELVYNTCS